MAERRFRIASWPNWSAQNPYQRLFYEALAPAAVHTSFACEVNDDWLTQQAGCIEAVHLHWPESLWRTRGDSWLGSLRGVVGLQRYLQLAGRLRLKRIWTIHNLEHHEGSDWIDRRGYRTLARHADLVICHSRAAAEAVHSRLAPRGEVVVMPHGNYAGEYPPPRDRASVRKQFDLGTNLPVFSCVGQIRDYKGFDLVAEIAGRFAGTAQFLIAGKANAGCDISKLRAAAAACENLRLVEENLNDQQFADAIGVSEAVILPYRKITGSGALLAAWTLGRPVIASDLPYFRETATPYPAGARLFRTGDVQSLAAAITELLTADRQAAREAARQLNDHYAWTRCVEPVVEVINRWQPPTVLQNRTRSRAMGGSALL